MKINYICLEEPNKLDVLKYLGIATKAEDIGRVEPDATVTIPRKAEAALIDVLEGTAYHIRTTITSEGVSIDAVEMLPKGVEPGITLEELIAAEETVKRDPRVQKYAADVGVKPDQIFAGEFRFMELTASLISSRAHLLADRWMVNWLG